jgi:HEAT repeat protein
MVTLFEDARMNPRGRAQILDLLAGTGTPKAQEAMRAALESPDARAGGHFDMLMQRFSLVSRPTPESIAFVEQTMREASGGAPRMAASYAMGAIAGNALRAGDETAGPRYGTEMLGSLASARSPDEKRAVVAGLGNLGWTGAVPKLRELAHDGDPSTRAAAAWSLRKTDTPEAREALLDLASDSSPEVEDRALEAMAALPSLDADDLASLSHAVARGATSPQADSSLLSLLTAHTDGGEPVASMLRVLLARNDADKHMAAEIRHALAAMQ